MIFVIAVFYQERMSRPNHSKLISLGGLIRTLIFLHECIRVIACKTSEL